MNGSICVKMWAEVIKLATNCETCANFYYDDETEEYTCDVSLDEDEMVQGPQRALLPPTPQITSSS